MTTLEQTSPSFEHTMTSTEYSHVPTWKAWLVPMSAALFFFYEFIQMLMINSLRPDLMQAFGLQGMGLGLLSAVYFWANMIFLFPAGILLDRFSVKKIVLIALGICVAGTLAFSQSTSFLLAAVLRFFTGIGSAFCFLACVRLAVRWLPARRLALASGFIVTMAFLGGAVANAPMMLLVHAVGWRHAVFIDGLVGLLFFLIILLFVKDWPSDAVRKEARDTLVALGFWQSLRQSYLKIHNWLCGIYTNMMNLPIFILGGVWGSGYLIQARDLSPTMAATVSGMILVGSLVGCPCVGWFSDRVNRRRSPMIAGAIISVALMLVVLYANHLSYMTLLALYFLLGFITSTQILSYPYVAQKNLPAFTATSVSVVSFNVISGGAIFPPIIGVLLDKHWDGTLVHGIPAFSAHDYRSAFIVLPIGLAIALLVVCLTREKAQQA